MSSTNKESSAPEEERKPKKSVLTHSLKKRDTADSLLMDAAEKASAEILQRLQASSSSPGLKETKELEIDEAMRSLRREMNPLATEELTMKRDKSNRISCDSLHTLRKALGSTSVMAPPHHSDLFMNGEAGGVAEDISVIHDWLDHIDGIIQRSYDEGLDMDPFDLSTFLIRKSTLFCSLHRLEESIACASAALDLVVTSLALYRLACANYLLANYATALDFILQANEMERYNPHIECALLVILMRLRSRKDRTEAVIINS